MLKKISIKGADKNNIEYKIDANTILVNNTEDHYCAYEFKELKLKQHLIFDLINLGHGEVTLESIDKLVEIERKSLVPEYLDSLIAHK